MKDIIKYICLGLIVVGAGVAYFSDIPVVDYVSLAAAFASAGVLCATTFKKSEKKDWKVYVAMVCIAVGAFGAGFCGVAGDTITKVITAIVSVIALVLGIVLTSVKPKKTE